MKGARKPAEWDDGIGVQGACHLYASEDSGAGVLMKLSLRWRLEAPILAAAPLVCNW